MARFPAVTLSVFSPVTPSVLPLRTIFRAYQFRDVSPHLVFPRIPQTSGRLSSSETFFQSSFGDSVTERSYYMSSQLWSLLIRRYV
jgi:hypothetical protein